MIATVINAIAVIAGGILGLLVKGRFTERFREIITQATGLAVIFIGAEGAIEQLLLPEHNPVLFVVSLVIGGLAGEALDIEGALKRLGDRLESMCGTSGGVSKSFVSASLLFCVGSMSILGSVQSGLNHDYSILLTKSILDGIYAVIFASSLGFGVLFAAVTILVYQGGITLAAGFIEPYISADVLRELSLVGGILIAGLGIDMLGIRKLKVGNLLPSMLVPALYYGILHFVR